MNNNNNNNNNGETVMTLVICTQMTHTHTHNAIYYTLIEKVSEHRGRERERESQITIIIRGQKILWLGSGEVLLNVLLNPAYCAKREAKEKIERERESESGQHTDI